jgi:hypothetical protein
MLPCECLATTQRGCDAKNPISFARGTRRLKSIAPDASAPCAWKTCFAISRTIAVTCDTGASSQMVVQHHHLGT